MEIVAKQDSNVNILQLDGITLSFDTVKKSASISLFGSTSNCEAFLSKRFNPSELCHSVSDGSDAPQIKLSNFVLNAGIELYFDSLHDYLTVCNFLEISADIDVCFTFESLSEASA
ncbi:hypothetical protein Q6U66_000468 [Vibrio vulnificus]|nr:hypothetical protein [Vibrio vulnificus]MCU8412849.1 hypothetical protein [Vibrio vulnificus]HAS8545555.1 hypothetical protein [Vibrio vulnificus]